MARSATEITVRSHMNLNILKHIEIVLWSPPWHLSICYWQIFWHSISHIFWHIFWHCIWHFIWHSIWHTFWHSIWHSVWHILWHFIWHIFWHSIWHSIWHLFWHSIWLLRSSGASSIGFWWKLVWIHTQWSKIITPSSYPIIKPSLCHIPSLDHQIAILKSIHVYINSHFLNEQYPNPFSHVFK